MTRMQAEEKILEIDQGLTDTQADTQLGSNDSTELNEP
jgi:hypothetical protein